MIIDFVDVFIISLGCNFVMFKIMIFDGIVGWGDVMFNGCEFVVVVYFFEYVVLMFIGRDEDWIEDIWQYFYCGLYWCCGLVIMVVIVVVDMVLWDIKVKKVGMFLYQLLGGVSREGVCVYVYVFGIDYVVLQNVIIGYQEFGYIVVCVQIGVLGFGQIYGVFFFGLGVCYDYEFVKCFGDCFSEEIWDICNYFLYMLGVFVWICEDFGMDLWILYDGYYWMFFIEVVCFVKEIEFYDLFWFEDCMFGEDQMVLCLVCQYLIILFVIGEVFNLVFDYQMFIIE